jgi:hypothetical protein
VSGGNVDRALRLNPAGIDKRQQEGRDLGLRCCSPLPLPLGDAIEQGLSAALDTEERPSEGVWVSPSRTYQRGTAHTPTKETAPVGRVCWWADCWAFGCQRAW